MVARDLIFEIGTEEIPARFMTWGLRELDRLAREDLAALRVPFESLRTIGTPRRTVLCVKGLAEKQDDLEETVKGPPKTQALGEDGEYGPAALGFARSRGVDVSALRFEAVNGVEYLFATLCAPGKPTAELLPDFLSGLIKKLAYPKSMYWDAPTLRFARPVRWLLALWGESEIPVSFGHVVSSRETRGHRFLGASSITVASAGEYVAALEREYVIVDNERRKAMILEGISEIEREMGGKCDSYEELVEENTHLVEYPFLFRGSFAESFLDIPEEVLIATMVKNQRYFPMRSASGKLIASFIGVSGNKARDMSVVREGNERVLRARFCDAAFFWKEDQTVSLESRLSSLEKVLYQEKLGSVMDKVNRVRGLSSWLVEALYPSDAALASDVERAALLAKADLVTGMVFEFPEVQGVMGREYALRGGERESVARAIFEQYLPRFAGDELPVEAPGAIIGLCDRADTIVGIHKAGMPPTGSQDPYGLRRAARCINETVWGRGMDVDLGELFKRAAAAIIADEASLSAAQAFYRQRLHNQLRERGFTHGTTSLAVASMWYRPLQALRMLEAFEESSSEEWFAALITSAIRVGNILARLSPEDRAAAEGGIGTLFLPEEKNLHEVLSAQSPKVQAALAACDWHAVVAALAELSPAIAKFFDGVMVMDDDCDVRRNRLALLLRGKALFDSIGDFSLLKA